MLSTGAASSTAATAAAGAASVDSGSGAGVTVLMISSVVVVVVVTMASDAAGVISLDDPFSVVAVSALVDGTTTVDSVTFTTCVTVVPFTASELALRLLESCLKFAWSRRLSPSSSSESDNSRSSATRRSLCNCEMRCKRHR